VAGVILLFIMHHTFLVVVKWLKSVCIYGSYRKIKTGVPVSLFGQLCDLLETRKP